MRSNMVNLILIVHGEPRGGSPRDSQEVQGTTHPESMHLNLLIPSSHYSGSVNASTELPVELLPGQAALL